MSVALFSGHSCTYPTSFSNPIFYINTSYLEKLFYIIRTYHGRDATNGSSPVKLMHNGVKLEEGKKLMDYDQIVHAGCQGTTITLFVIPDQASGLSISGRNNNAAQAAAPSSLVIEPMSISSPVRSKSRLERMTNSDLTPGRERSIRQIKQHRESFNANDCHFFCKVIGIILALPFLILYGFVLHAQASPISFCCAFTTFIVFEIIGIVRLLSDPYYAQVNYLGIECACIEGYGITYSDTWAATEKNPYQPCGDNCMCQNLCNKKWDGDQDSTQTCPGIITYNSYCWANFECASVNNMQSDSCSVGDSAYVDLLDCWTEWDCEALHESEIYLWNSTAGVSLAYKKPWKVDEALYTDSDSYYAYGWAFIGSGFVAYCVVVAGVHTN